MSPTSTGATTGLTDDDDGVIDALKARDEVAFTRVVARYHGRLLRLAQTYVDNAAVAEEVVQETWLGVLAGIDRFERQSAFTTWLFRICVNRAITRATREGRTIALSSLEDGRHENGEPAVAADRFHGDAHPDWAGHWTVAPKVWGSSPENQLLNQETLELIQSAVAGLPPLQRHVITLRDVDGLSADEVCNVLDISATNQRVLLHRARNRVRVALERHFSAD